MSFLFLLHEQQEEREGLLTKPSAGLNYWNIYFNKKISLKVNSKS